MTATFSDRQYLGPTRTEILAPMGTSFEKAFATFRVFFRQVTGVHWDYRLWDNANPMNIASKRAARDEAERVKGVAGSYGLEQSLEVGKQFLDLSPAPLPKEQDSSTVSNDSPIMSEQDLAVLKRATYPATSTRHEAKDPGN